MQISISEEVREAAAKGLAVALETSVVAQGLPYPANLECATRCAKAVRAAGAVPAAIAVLEGRVRIGANDGELSRLADPEHRPAKAGVRDLGALVAAGRDAGTTVSATCALAALAGIRVFATGGIGGVHRVGPGEPPDISSDLHEIARRPVAVVCAGPKAILDVPATAELLETLGIPVLGLGTRELPAFYTGSSGIALEHSFDGPDGIARALHAHWSLLGSTAGGALVAVPPPQALSREQIEAALLPALDEARRRKLPGKEMTPFLLGALSRATQGQTQTANLALLENNARRAGEIAVALSKLPRLA